MGGDRIETVARTSREICAFFELASEIKNEAMT